MDENTYHYTECGLDHVYLLNGFKHHESTRGPSISIREIDALHETIGRHLCLRNQELSGKEIRFLRVEMLLSKGALARIFKVKEAAVHRWETEKNSISGPADRLLRTMYLEHVSEGKEGSLRALLKQLADIEDEIDPFRELVFELPDTQPDGNASVASQAQWRLAA